MAFQVELPTVPRRQVSNTVGQTIKELKKNLFKAVIESMTKSVWMNTGTRFLIFTLATSLAWSGAAAMQQASYGDSTQYVTTAADGDELPLGIVKEKPAEGRFVETDHGFMVPYTATIPGTDVTFEMVPIPGGTFQMGSPQDEEDRRDDEGPQFEVAVEPFWIGKHEVTWAEYKKYMELDKHFKSFQQTKTRVINDKNEQDAITAPSSLYDPSFTFEAGEEPNEPAATMTQYAAKQYTKWLSLLSGQFYRLPYESEWEYACRAGTTTPFYFGDDPDELEEHAWYYDNSDELRHAVGELKPNPWGLYDMYGNVAEWVLDEYAKDHYAQFDGKNVSVADALNKPEKLYPRVLRGGSWELELEDCRSAARLASDDEEWKLEDPNFPKSPWWYTDTPGLGSGFRLIRPLMVPADRNAKEAFWKADVEEIIEDAKNRITDNGRGAYGIVDPQLPKAIEQIDENDK